MPTLNLVNAVPSLLDKRLPISLVPRASLSVILESVHEAQMQNLDRLTLAIPMQDITSYYDAKLVREISTVPQGLLLTLAIPLSSSETVFDVYRAYLIPMPAKDPGVALQWKIEGPYLAISENTMESTVLSFEQFEECLGSARYKICHKTMETHLGQSSCLATLYFHNAIAALQVCEPEQISLPTPEKATNLGYGIWLLTSASDAFTLREFTRGLANSVERTDIPGCTICIITLECGIQMASKHIKIRPDLGSCDKIPAKRLTIQLPDPLEAILSKIPPIEELPYFRTRAEATSALVTEVRAELVKSQYVVDVTHHDKLATPIAARMTQLKPTLVNKFNTYVPIRTSLTLTAVVFVANILLHLLVMYLYYHFRCIRDLVPNFIRTPNGNVPLKPLVTVDSSHSKVAATYVAKKERNFALVKATELANLQKDKLTSLRKSLSDRRKSAPNLHESGSSQTTTALPLTLSRVEIVNDGESSM